MTMNMFMLPQQTLLVVLLLPFSRCQTTLDDDDDDDDTLEDDIDDDDDVSSVLSLAPTSVPAQTSIATTASLAPLASSVGTPIITSTTIGTTPSVISTFSTSDISPAHTESAELAGDTILDPRPTPGSPAALSTGAKAGIGVGVGMFVLLCLGVLLFEWRRRRLRRTRTKSGTHDPNGRQQDSKSPRDSSKRRRRTAVDDHYAADSNRDLPNGYPQQEVYARYGEKDSGQALSGLTRSTTERHELSAEVPTYELEGGGESKQSPEAPQSPSGRTILSPISPL